MKRSLSLRIACCLPLLLAALSFSGGPARGETIPVSFISYNIQFLPGLAAFANLRPMPAYRSDRIAEEMAKFDIVGLQEAFYDEFRERIIAAMRGHWDGVLHHVESPKVDHRYMGGCVTLTRFPMLASHGMAFEHFSSPRDYGLAGDGFVSKGVIHARIARGPEEPENYIDVFNTHLEARASYLRPKQYVEMAEFIAEHSDPERPVVILGDLNTRGAREYREDPDSLYSQMMRAFNGARPDAPFVDVWPHLMGEDAWGGTTNQESEELGNRIDYVLVSNPAAGVQLAPREIRVELYQDPKTVALSDHNAVVAVFDWPAAE